MLSLSKIILLVIVIAVVMRITKFLSAKSASHAVPAPQEEKQPKEEILVKCNVCGVYRPSGHAGTCERSDCPTRQKS